jgi:hypothetical protein
MTRLEEGATVAMPNATALSEWVYPELRAFSEADSIIALIGMPLFEICRVTFACITCTC